MKKKGISPKVFLLISAIFPIWLGGIIYYLFCPEVIFVKELDSLLGGRPAFSFGLCQSTILCFLRCYALDCIWAYSLTLILYLIIGNRAHTVGVCLLSSIILGALLEALQLFGIAAGTADLLDVLAEGLGAAVAACIIKKHWRNRK